MSFPSCCVSGYFTTTHVMKCSFLPYADISQCKMVKCHNRQVAMWSATHGMECFRKTTCQFSNKLWLQYVLQLVDCVKCLKVIHRLFRSSSNIKWSNFSPTLERMQLTLQHCSTTFTRFYCSHYSKCWLLTSIMLFIKTCSYLPVHTISLWLWMDSKGPSIY